MSNGFGRRQTITRESVSSSHKTSTDADADSGGAGFSLPKPLIGVLAGIAVVSMLFGSHVVAMKQFGGALDQHWAQNAGFPDVDRAYKQSGSSSRLLEQVHNNCFSQAEFPGDDRPRSTAEVMSAVGITVGRAVKYVSCVAGEQPKRLCGRDHRMHLFAALNDYYKLQAKIRDEHSWRNAGHFGPSFGGPERETFATTLPRSSDTDPRIVSSLKLLISSGYLSRRDLIEATEDWPNDLGVALRGVEPKQKGCA
jgi:hypothetical protein